MQTVSATPTLIQKETGGCIAIGSKVTVRFASGNTRTFTITNEAQAVAPEHGVISDQSPLGSALLGKTVGDSARFAVGAQASSVEIVEVETAKRE